MTWVTIALWQTKYINRINNSSNSRNKTFISYEKPLGKEGELCENTKT